MLKSTGIHDQPAHNDYAISETAEQQLFRRIVVALDQSAEAWAALALAARLARRSGAMLTLVHTFKPIPRPLGDPYFQEHIEQQILAGEQLLARADKSMPDLQAEHELIEGSPAEAILAVAERQQADLIVMGAHGAGVLHAALGSVSSKVLGRAPCPVLISRG